MKGFAPINVGKVLPLLRLVELVLNDRSIALDHTYVLIKPPIIDRNSEEGRSGLLSYDYGRGVHGVVTWFEEALGYIALQMILYNRDYGLRDVAALGSVRAGNLMTEVKLQVRDV
jgi:hypothetical protein